MMNALLLIALAASTASASPGAKVVGSKHDFSATGPGINRLSEADSPCAFCHISHSGAPGLSNRPDPSPSHEPYRSSSLKGRSERPDGSSRNCLSCHDGTVAVGSTRVTSRKGFSQPAGDWISPGRPGYLGTDLRGSHPISIRPAASGRAVSPPPGGPVALDGSGKVQCTSCHDPHRESGDPQLGMFLAMPVSRSALCLTCHPAGTFEPSGSTHASSGAGLPGDVTANFSSVAEAGCLACHAMHGAPPDSLLVLRGPSGELDSACLRCHAAGLAATAVGIDAGKPYSHSVPGPHDAAEGPAARARIPETSPGTRRHAGCVDCHDPHAANSSPAIRPFAGGALAGVWGIDLGGQRVEPVKFEYEICFKCHADSANQPQAGGSLFPDTVRRAKVDVNLRRVFAATAASSHPVATPRRQPNVPSLKTEWRDVPGILCSDCHSSDGGGVRGPHGSSIPHLLEREYRTADRTVEGPDAYALCYKCHDRSVLLSDASSFPPHRLHVVDQNAACATCHNAHGVSDQAGTANANAHLIDFDTTVVKPDPAGLRSYESLGVAAGRCALTCHDHTHRSPTGAY